MIFQCMHAPDADASSDDFSLSHFYSFCNAAESIPTIKRSSELHKICIAEVYNEIFWGVWSCP